MGHKHIAGLALLGAAMLVLPACATKGYVNEQITGVNVGPVTVSASGPGYATASTSAQVTATVSFPGPAATISGFITQNILLTLSAAAPAGGRHRCLPGASCGASSWQDRGRTRPRCSTRSRPRTDSEDSRVVGARCKTP